MEVEDLKQQAVDEDREIHIGTVFCFNSIKHCEQELEKQTDKARCVYQGNTAKDASGYDALYSQNGSSGAHIVSGNLVDAYGHCPGNAKTDADARQAYTQSLMCGEGHIETWVVLLDKGSRHLRPQSWRKFNKPAAKLLRALEGHPRAGTYWEQHCAKHVFKCGFVKIEGWACLYWHRQYKLLLFVYVDDFKLGGPQQYHEPMWNMLRAELDIDDYIDNATFLGKNYTAFQPTLNEINQRNYIYQFVFNAPKKDLKKVQAGAKPLSDDTFYEPPMRKHDWGIDTSQHDAVSSDATRLSFPQLDSVEGIRGYYYDQAGFLLQCCEKYCEVVGIQLTDLKHVVTPFIQECSLTPHDYKNPGTLTIQSAQIVLKVLFATRQTRPSLSFMVNFLARNVNKWTLADDKRIRRLMEFIYHTRHWRLHHYVGNPAHELTLIWWSDSSWADDPIDSRSTSGGFLCLVGTRTYVPLAWLCKRQGTTATSSTMAETIALEMGIRCEAIPALDAWEQILTDVAPPGWLEEKRGRRAKGRKSQVNDTLHQITRAHGPTQCPFRQALSGEIDYITPSLPPSEGYADLKAIVDNDATCMSLQTGRIRDESVYRHNRIHISFLRQCFRDPSITLRYANTAYQIADIFTKQKFTEAQFKQLCYLLQEFPSEDLQGTYQWVKPPHDLTSNEQTKPTKRTRPPPPELDKELAAAQRAKTKKRAKQRPKFYTELALDARTLFHTNSLQHPPPIATQPTHTISATTNPFACLSSPCLALVSTSSAASPMFGADCFERQGTHQNRGRSRQRVDHQHEGSAQRCSCLRQGQGQTASKLASELRTSTPGHISPFSSCVPTRSRNGSRQPRSPTTAAHCHIQPCTLVQLLRRAPLQPAPLPPSAGMTKVEQTQSPPLHAPSCM